MEGKRFLNAYDVAYFMGISVLMAYKIIRRLNNDLSAKGFIAIAGKVSRCYSEQKIYGGTAVRG